MSGNIIDYVKWRGDLTFDVDPFNDVDNICIAQSAYTNLDGLIKENEKVTMKVLAKRFFKVHNRKEVAKSKSFVAESPFLFEEMGKSKRFGNAVLSNYVSIVDPEKSIQFAAYRLDLDDGTTYIAFRGTDDTLVGWYEDLQMSYQIVPSQTCAVDYLNRVGKNIKNLRIGGHSKGGNLAAYASALCDRDIYNNIIAVYSNDGPGLGVNLLKYTKQAELSKYYRKIIPENDFFGTIFDDSVKKIVVKANDSSFLCHNSLTWLVEGNQFVTAKKTTVQSDSIKRGISNFLKETKPEQREKFVHQLYKALTAAGVVNITDLAEGGLPLIVKTLTNIAKMEPDVKETANRLLKIIVNSYSDEFNNYLANQKKNLLNKTEEVGKNIKKGFFDLEKSLYNSIKNNH